MEKHRQQTYGHGERGVDGEMYGESNMETYITICKIIEVVRVDILSFFPLLGWGGGRAEFDLILKVINPRDGGAWWAAVYGITQSQTRLKGLSSSSMYTYGSNIYSLGQ